MGRASKLITDLANVPSIIGGLGLSVSEAQKAFNVDYVESLERILGLIKATLAPESDEAKEKVEAQKDVIQSLLKELAPSRYQFTETTLAVKLDLAQTLDTTGQFGAGGAVGAVAVNAALTVGFGYDYRAAAEVRTVLHAVPSDQEVMNKLLDRAEQIGAQALELPPGADVDTQLVDGAVSFAEKAADATLAKPKPKTDTTG